MAWLQQKLNRVGRRIAILTDWLLVALGGIFILLGWFRIDIPGAEYVILAGGIVLAALGFWYRHRRLQRERQAATKKSPSRTT